VWYYLKMDSQSQNQQVADRTPEIPESVDELINYQPSKQNSKSNTLRYLAILVAGAVAVVLIVLGLSQFAPREPNIDQLRQAIATGKINALGGRIISIDTKNGTFQLDTDSVGGYGVYKIITSSKTKFTKRAVPDYSGYSEEIPSEVLVEIARTEDADATFADLVVGALADVFFAVPIHLDDHPEKLAVSEVVFVIR
jgi:hypothetical protein